VGVVAAVTLFWSCALVVVNCRDRN
jgi:hypothetical protein